MYSHSVYILVLSLPFILSFTSYRPPSPKYQASDLSGASSYGGCCECGYSGGSPDSDYIVQTALVLAAVGWLVVAAAAFAALFLSVTANSAMNKRSLSHVSHDLKEVDILKGNNSRIAKLISLQCEGWPDTLNEYREEVIWG